jgi:membrane-bound serine protease (ClpP class)
VAVTLPFAAITMMLVSLVMRARRGKVITGEQGLLMEIGEARTPLIPRGKVFVHGEYWDAEAPTPVEAGTRVRVVAVDGLLLKVEALEVKPN